MSLTATWLPLALAGVQGLAPLAARSSHALAVLGDKAYIFGGELKPRTPIGDELLVLDLAGGPPRVLSRASAPWPAPRVGATLVSHQPSRSLYLWGGRGGKDMAPLAMRSSGAAGASEEAEEDVWKFDTRSEQWQLLNTRDGAPSGRSYHAATVAGDTMYIHAGCPTKGRLETLHALDLTSLRWTQCADAPAPGRGGTAITAVRSPAGDSDVLLRWGGFAGYELGGPLDVFDVHTNTWSSHAAPLKDGDGDGEPRKRSVHGFVPLPLGFSRSADQDAVALLFFGEGEGAPAELGHDGAGKFLDDVLVLLRSTAGTYAFEAVQTSGSLPQARGWFASGVATDVQGSKSVVLHGGLNEHNERLADAWKLELRASSA